MTVTVVVLDSVGLGALPDAEAFGDAGAHTLDHTLAASGVVLPHLARLGLGNIEGVRSVAPVAAPLGAYGRLSERSPGKDTTTGHWEFMGVVVDRPFRTFERFPEDVMDAFDEATGRPHLGNRAASGTEIIEELGARHLERGAPIVYTSADSVFQVAAHVDVVPLETLYAWCEAARAILTGDRAVARVIARPFRGAPGAFERLNGKRRDYSVAPPHTVLNALEDAGREVVGIGKIGDIYAGSGLTRTVKTDGNDDGVTRTVEAMRERSGSTGRGRDGLIFTNLVDFDARYGHRRDPNGYGSALAAFDARLPELMAATAPGDVLLLISDHGNDPTWRGTDHTREYGLLLAYGPSVTEVEEASGTSRDPASRDTRSRGDLGTRASFADVGATVADLLGVRWDGSGDSFADALR